MKYSIGEHDPIYIQFELKPKEAIKHLMKVKKGECIRALYRKDIGYVDIVCGENDPKTNTGYGLKHIVEMHGKEIKELGLTIEDFIPIAFYNGKINIKRSTRNRICLESKLYRIIVATEC